MPDFFTRDELLEQGCQAVGENVRVHRTAVLINASRISIGDETRIDCFSLISAGQNGVVIGSHVHVAAGCYLFGGGGRILLDDFCGLSSRVAVYTATDDYREGFLTNPTIPDEFRKVRSGPVTFHRHAVVGAGCVVLPDVELGFGSSVGALTCVRKSIAELQVCVGNAHATRTIGQRSRDRLQSLERKLRESEFARRRSA